MKDFFIRFCNAINENPNREGLKNTPDRIIKSWERIYSGYSKNPKEIFKNTFKEHSCNEMIVIKNIEFYSMCEHHMLPFFGHISFGYIPDTRIIGISKIIDVVNIYARRLQIQENLTTQIADIFMEELKPKGVMVVTEATHMCMVVQGIANSNAKLVTSAVRGTFKIDAKSRTEFMEHINK